MDVVEKAQAAYKAKEEAKQSHQDKLLSAEAYDAIQQAVIKSGVAQIAHRKIHEPKVEVKNFPDIASPKDIKSLKEAVDKLAKELKPEKYDDKSVVAALQEVKAAILAQEPPEMPEPVEEVTVKNQIDLKPLETAIKGIELKPVYKPEIKVSPTPITNTVDLSPVASAIEGLKEPKEFSFEDYIAQDIDEAIDGVQYVLLVNPNGGWGIIQNLEEENALRFLFGTGDYTEAWANIDNHKYKRIDEAVRDLQA